MVSDACEAVTGPAWNELWMRKSPTTPGRHQRVGDPVDEDVAPPLGHQRHELLGEGGRQREEDGTRRAEHGRPEPSGPGEPESGEDGGGQAPITTKTDDPGVPAGDHSPPAGRRHHQEGGQSAGGGGRPAPLPPGQVVAEPDAEDQDQEEQLGGDDGLHRAQLAEPQCPGLEQEPDADHGDPEEPDGVGEGVADQLDAHHRVGRRVLHADALEDGAQGVGQGGQHGEDVSHVQCLPQAPVGARRPPCPDAAGAIGAAGSGPAPAAGPGYAGPARRSRAPTRRGPGHDRHAARRVDRRRGRRHARAVRGGGPGVPRRQRRAPSRGDLRVGPGIREREPLSRADPRAAGRPTWPPRGPGPRRCSTPGSAGSPGPPSTAAAACRRTTSGSGPGGRRTT